MAGESVNGGDCKLPKTIFKYMHACIRVCVPLFIVLCMFIQHTTVRIRNIFSQCCAAQKALDSKKEREAGHGGHSVDMLKCP